MGAAGACEEAAGLSVLPSPVTPWKGAPLRVMFAAEKPLEGELSLIGPDGSVAVKSRERHGGPPYFWFAEVASPAAGTWRAKLTGERRTAGCGTITREIAVRADRPPPPHNGRGRLAGAQRLESRDRKPVSRPGSKSFSTRRSTTRCHGLRCMRCCATNRAICCSTIWVSAKTR